MSDPNPMIECPHCREAVDYCKARPADMRRSPPMERFQRHSMTLERRAFAQQAAREHAAEKCLSDGHPELFGERYESACAHFGVDPDARLPVPPRLQRPTAPARRTLGTDQEARAGERARDRALRDGKPDEYHAYYAEELARAS